MMKKFVVDCGKAIIDISAWIFVIMIIVVGLGTGAMALIIIPIGILCFVIVYYLLYLAIDIRENLQEINQSLQDIKNGSNSSEE